jgi:hypothetical protein
MAPSSRLHQRLAQWTKDLHEALNSPVEKLDLLSVPLSSLEAQSLKLKDMLERAPSPGPELFHDEFASKTVVYAEPWVQQQLIEALLQVERSLK